MIYGIIRFHIWKIRNRIKYDGETITTPQSIRILKWELLNHLELLELDKKIDINLIPILKDLIIRLRNTPIDESFQTRKRRLNHSNN